MTKVIIEIRRPINTFSGWRKGKTHSIPEGKWIYHISVFQTMSTACLMAAMVTVCAQATFGKTWTGQLQYRESDSDTVWNTFPVAMQSAWPLAILKHKNLWKIIADTGICAF